MKKTICIFALAGSAIALAAAIMHSNKKNERNKEVGVAHSMHSEVKENFYAVRDMENEKKHVTDTISERHKQAAQIVWESMTAMEKDEERNSKHKEEFDEIDNNLNMLLDEER